MWAAEASECAGEQGQFWPYHDKLFAEWQGRNIGSFSKDNLKRYAAQLGLDGAAFGQCLDSGQHEAKVQSELQEGQRLGVASLPTIFINGRMVKGNQPFATYQAIIEEALSKAQ